MTAFDPPDTTAQGHNICRLRLVFRSLHEDPLVYVLQSENSFPSHSYTLFTVPYRKAVRTICSLWYDSIMSCLQPPALEKKTTIMSLNVKLLYIIIKKQF